MLQARWTWLAFVGLILGTAAFLASCSDAREALGIGVAPLTVGPVVDIAPSRNELSGDWTPAGGTLDADILCVASNGSQWTWSQDHGANWNVCNNITASCNGDGGTFPPDSGPLATVWTMQGSDQTIVADKLGHVVWVSMADNNSGCPARGVVAMVSSDGGKTFDFNNAVLVNDNTCSNGCQDQPDGAFDYSTSPPTLVISWRHAGAGNGSANGACTRRYFINASNILQPMDDAYSVDNLGLDNIGAVRIRAGGGVMTIVYTTNGNVPRCPNTGTTTEGVASLSSYDWGDHWTSPYTIFSGNSYTGCLLSGQVEQAANPRNFDYVRAVDGTNYVVYQDTKSTVRLFMDTSYGAMPNELGASTWREWCAGTPTADGGPTTNWLNPSVGSTFLCATPFYTQGQASADAGSGNSLAMPVLAADDQGRLATWFYEADSTDTLFHVHFRGNVSPRSPTSTWTDVDVSPNFMPGVCGPNCGNAFRALGDYEAMLVQGALRQPTCGDAGTFFPTWTFANSDAGIDANALPNPQSLDGGLTFP
jgi:hypothetical protein